MISDPSKPQAVNDLAFEVGEWVHWTETTRKGRGFNLSKKEGRIVLIKGRWAEVKMRNGRIRETYLSQLRKDGDTSELTEFVQSLAQG